MRALRFLATIASIPMPTRVRQAAAATVAGGVCVVVLFCERCFCAVRLMLSIAPRYTQLMNVDVPPLLMSGSGCPVTGSTPTATHILNSACVTSIRARPMAR